MIEAQRLRNLTTGILHTEIKHVYEDLEYITGMQGIMTHMLPRVNKAVLPWLKDKIKEPRYWDGKFDQDHGGEEFLRPMTDVEVSEMLDIYSSLPCPLLGNKSE